MANEKRLIDPNDVYALFGENGMARLHVGDIDQIKRVYAVEVVRCKDCKHYDKTPLGNGDRCMCTKFLGLTIPRPDDFCSYG